MPSNQSTKFCPKPDVSPCEGKLEVCDAIAKSRSGSKHVEWIDGLNDSGRTQSPSAAAAAALIDFFANTKPLWSSRADPWPKPLLGSSFLNIGQLQLYNYYLSAEIIT